MFHMKNFLFGNALISIPFFDFAGILSDSDEAGVELLKAALEIRAELGAEFIELRHMDLAPFPEKGRGTSQNLETVFRELDVSYKVRTHKSRMLLGLPESSKTLLESFKSKLRSQIKKAGKEGLETRIGGEELLADFYRVFCENMRDLGSPVHSFDMLKNTLKGFSDVAKVVNVYCDDTPVACGMIIGFRDVMEHPWASSLRRYSRLSPNMLLYWAMLEYSSNRGFKEFDFGRSSPDEGTYKFKEQWGTKPSPLNWYCFGDHVSGETRVGIEKDKFRKVIGCWQKLPVCITKVVGPRIRKYISL